jgi:photosystem II stability/assembly factor-like uncharacterized protein
MRPGILKFIVVAFCGTILWAVNRPVRQASEQSLPTAQRFDGPAEFARLHRMIRTAPGDDKPGYTPGYQYRELRVARANALRLPPRTQAATVVWTERGPNNVPGRTRGLVVDPDDPTKNTWFAGSAGGGVWKTTNAGGNWTLITPGLSNLATTVLVMAPSQHDILYVGTGEGFFNLDAVTGNGIFKSSDRGQTWTHMATTTVFSDINRMAVSPTDPLVVVAATATGIYRTTDGWTTWTKVHGDPVDPIQDLKVNPANFQIQYAARYGDGVLKSIDGGLTWTSSSQGLNVSGRLELAVSPANPNRIFASAEGSLSGTESDLYLSSDAGATWSVLNVQWNGQALNFLGGQGWYDNTLMGDPFNQDIVYVGGVNLFRVTVGTGSNEVANYDMNEIDTESFMFLQAFANIVYSSGRLTAGVEAGQLKVEIRFGPGKSQKAHRFTVPGGATSGVPAASYAYANYVDVPFEAWDVTIPGSPRQLMVSFRDQANNGVFDLLTQNFGADALLNSREYVYVNNVDYAGTPNASIAQNGGHEFRLAYNFFPALTTGAVWQPSSLPGSTLEISYTGIPKVNASTITVSDAYNQYDGKNRFINFGIDVHPDQHNLVTIPTSATTYRILSASDGGIFISNASSTPGTTQGSWVMSGHSYRTAQFYGADKRPGFDQYVGGTQDNGTWISPTLGATAASTDYNFAFGGDGFEVIWHNLDDKKVIGGSQGNSFQRSMNGGGSWTAATSGLFGSHPFISKLANSRDNPDRIYALSSAGVFYSADFGGSWSASPITTKWGGSSSLMDVEVSRANANIVWAGSAMIEPQTNLHVSIDAGVTFTPANNPPASVKSGMITKLASHPTQPNTAYALFSQADAPKILRTTDLGQSWEDISGFDNIGNPVSNRGFPNVAVYCLYVRPDDTNILWAGTEIGIVESTDNGLSWALIPEFPAISVWDMKGQDDQVVIATHGRGIWTATVSVSQEGKRPVIADFGTSAKKELLLRIDLEEDYTRLDIYDGTSLVGTVNGATTGEWVATLPGIAPGLRSVKMIGYRGDAPVHSRTYAIDQLNLQPVGQSHADYFGSTQHVTVKGFQLGLFDDSGNNERRVMHSPHPYVIMTPYTVTVLKPVVVASASAFLFYEDVALVEPGLDGVAFGQPDFKDYVVMEATKNGLDWTALGPGYDARLHAEWSAAYSAGTPGLRSHLKQHQINLLDTFLPGDTLLFRYRLYSDEATTGWGAAMDYITIQEEPTGLEGAAGLSDLTVFPNPVNSQFTARYTLSEPSAVQFEVRDLSGRTVQFQSIDHPNPGTFEVSFDTRSQAPGTYVLRMKTGRGDRTSKIIISR